MNLGQLVVDQGKNFLNNFLKYARIVVVNYVMEINSAGVEGNNTL
jgi:hypothetical protein